MLAPETIEVTEEHIGQTLYCRPELTRQDPRKDGFSTAVVICRNERSLICVDLYGATTCRCPSRLFETQCDAVLAAVYERRQRALKELQECAEIEAAARKL